MAAIDHKSEKQQREEMKIIRERLDRLNGFYISVDTVFCPKQEYGVWGLPKCSDYRTYWTKLIKSKLPEACYFRVIATGEKCVVEFAYKEKKIK